MNCGEKIAALRKSRNMTQTELGNAMNVTYQAVSKRERGESEPDFDTMSKTVKFFDVPISYFEGGGQLPAHTEPAETSANEAAQMLGVRTEGGHIITLPGIIFLLSPDGLLFLILRKFFLQSSRQSYSCFSFFSVSLRRSSSPLSRLSPRSSGGT